VPPSAEGRWTLVGAPGASATAWAAAQAQQLLARHGVVTRDVAAIEHLPGGFAAMYPVLRRLEDTGRVRRGYFVAGLGAAQFAQPGAVDLLRAARVPDDHESITVTLTATDPANPYGALIPWATEGTQKATDETQMSSSRGATRTVGARVVIVDGRLACWIGRGDRALVVTLPDEEPERSRVGHAMARELVAAAHRDPDGRRGRLIAEINGAPAAAHPASRYLLEAGFTATSQGLQLRVPRPPSPQASRPPHA
jgi:ATP-dependent Lhr-like helicase